MYQAEHVVTLDREVWNESGYLEFEDGSIAETCEYLPSDRPRIRRSDKLIAFFANGIYRFPRVAILHFRRAFVDTVQLSVLHSVGKVRVSRHGGV